MEWISLDGQSSNNLTKSNNHWDANTKYKFEEPQHAKNFAKALPKCTKQLKCSKKYSPSKNIKPPIKTSKDCTSATFEIEKIMRNVAETHAFIK